MIVEERFAVAAPPEQLWGFFLDVPRAAACMPGVERIESIDDRTYRGQIEVKVGPLKASFQMDVTIEELQSPETIRVSLRGADRRAGSFVDGRATIVIHPREVAHSAVTMVIDVGIRGPLGRFGQVIIRDTVRKLTEQFFACVERGMAEQNPDSRLQIPEDRRGH